jgi:cullin 1
MREADKTVVVLGRSGRVQLPLVLWRDRFFDKVKGPIIGAVLKMIERDRRGDLANTSLVKRVVDSCVDLSRIQEKDAKDELALYTLTFERPFVEATRQYYQADAEAFLATHTLREYMKRVEACLQDEVKRVHMYLHRRTEQVVLYECEQTLIVRHRDAIADEFVILLRNDSFEGMEHACAGG